MKRVGIIGYGTMGEAIATALHRKQSHLEIIAFDNAEIRLDAVSSSGFCRPASSAAEVFRSADTILLAVKPQYLGDLAQDVADSSRTSNIISIAAGVSVAALERHFNTSSIIRFMPNLAAKTGSALVAVFMPDGVDAEFRRAALFVAEAIGTPMQLPEHLLAPVTGLSGSGIAYVFELIHSMALGGVKSGIAYPQSLEITIQTIRGAVDLLEKEKEHPISLLSKVTSAGGTTIEGVHKLEENRFVYALIEAVQAAANRAIDLET